MKSEEILEFQDIKIKVPWGYVAGRWHGNRKVRPILAIHGHMDNVGTWDRLVPLLPRHVGVLCIELPGHGLSSKYPVGINYHVTDFVYIIIGAIKEYQWKKVSLMGHSMGATICFQYACLYPDTVDMIIFIDSIMQLYHFPADVLIKELGNRVEKLVLENQSLENVNTMENRCYTYEELVEILHKGTLKSIEKENCKYVLTRTINRSKLYPEKYYFSRDNRLKHIERLTRDRHLILDMAKRMQNMNCLIIRASKSKWIPDYYVEVIEIMGGNNSNLEFHVIEGTHHIHINNPKDVADVVGPFIQKNLALENTDDEVGNKHLLNVNTKSNL